MSFTSAYLLYTKGDLINNHTNVVLNSFYQIDDKSVTNAIATDANVYCLVSIMRENETNVYCFNPMREHTFNNTNGTITKAGDKDATIPHITKKIYANDLLTKYNIYKVFVQLNRGSFLSYVPFAGSSINAGLGYIPGSGLLTDTLNVAQGVGSSTVNAVTGRGGSGKRKQKTKTNKKKNRKTKRKTKK